MMQVTIEQAKANLDDLIQRAQSGEDILIEDSGTPIAQLTRPQFPQNGVAKHKRRTPGFLNSAGFYMAEDFDAPLEDFAEYM